MGRFSFDIKDSRGLFDKLSREYQSYLKDKTSSDHAVNFSMTAYHLFERCDEELDISTRTELKEKRKQIEEDVQIIRDIANGTKHKIITRYPPKIRIARKGDGGFRFYDSENGWGIKRMALVKTIDNLVKLKFRSDDTFIEFAEKIVLATAHNDSIKIDSSVVDRPNAY